MYSFQGRMEHSQQKPVTPWDKVSWKLTNQCHSEGTPNISSAPQNDGSLVALRLTATALQCREGR